MQQQSRDRGDRRSQCLFNKPAHCRRRQLAWLWLCLCLRLCLWHSWSDQTFPIQDKPQEFLGACSAQVPPGLAWPAALIMIMEATCERLARLGCQLLSFMISQAAPPVGSSVDFLINARILHGQQRLLFFAADPGCN